MRGWLPVGLIGDDQTPGFRPEPEGCGAGTGLNFSEFELKRGQWRLTKIIRIGIKSLKTARPDAIACNPVATRPGSVTVSKA